MGKDHRGHPSGVNKSEGSGVPGGKFVEDLQRDEELQINTPIARIILQKIYA
jgi:hypothetical protein